MTKQVGLDYDDLEMMTIGMCLDFMDEYIDRKDPKRKKVRQAKQKDFDSF